MHNFNRYSFFIVFFFWFKAIFLLYITDDATPLLLSGFDEFLSSLCADSSAIVSLLTRLWKVKTDNPTLQFLKFNFCVIQSCIYCSQIRELFDMAR